MAQNEKKVGKTRTRATSSELCERHKKERSHLYYERRKVKKELDKGGLTDRKLGLLFKRQDNINSKIGKLNVKIFRCGKRYSKWKVKLKKLKSESSKLSKKIKFDRSISDKEKDKLLEKYLKMEREIKDLNVLLGMEIYEKKKGELTLVTDFVEGTSTESLPIWVLRDEVLIKFKTGNYDKLIVDGRVFDYKTQEFEINELLDDIKELTLASQVNSRVKTPMAFLTEDLTNKTLTIS